ncbi:MAG: thymidine phosphorylase [Clostridiales Family XIII bacterium]|jgi:pyrimidine-nucleoside phosphorylase|nr:thymidine phosphorylase [Clostridiales Family XIII bacterium]
MDMYGIIQKKRDGGTLSDGEIRYFVDAYTAGAIPDYQAAALLMAMFFNELSRGEIFALTQAMRDSGDRIDLSSIKGIKVDKHSTGGVGDKTTFIAAPLAAACGVPVAKMSGRGLGFTGGTIDKMESIPGMRTGLGTDEFVRLVKTGSIAVTGQTGRVAPADKKIYALRDVTATVDILGLIASSVMSKKLSSGSDALVLDVKCGSGAFMETVADAEKLGRMMADIGEAAGMETVALVTDMQQPLGHAVGNSIEVIEAIETLKGRGPEDITELSLELCAYMLLLGGKASSRDEGLDKAASALKSGAGLAKFRSFVAGQGGDPRAIDDYGLFPQAAFAEEIKAAAGGYVTGLAARGIGNASREAGAGRAAKDDIIDLAAGVQLRKKIGDPVEPGAALAVVYGNDEMKVKGAAAAVGRAFSIGPEKPQARRLVHAAICGKGRP